jgi:hypothetical protein
MSAVGSMVSSSIGPGAIGANPLGMSPYQAAAARAAFTSTSLQAVSMASGQQGRFDWRAVAASAVGAGLGQGAQVGFGAQAAPSALSTALGETFGEVGRGTVFGMMSGAAASAVGSGRVMARQVAVDAFGNALGQGLLSSMQGGVDWSGAPDESTAETLRLARTGNASASSSVQPGAEATWPEQYETATVPTPEQLQAAFRQSERDYRSATERSVAGAGRVAQAGDSISRMLRTSGPQAIGNFIRANGLSSSTIEAGRNYFIPDDVAAYGDAAALGQAVLDGDNRRIDALAREQFNFSDGRDANDIRGSFGYRSRVSREISDMTGTRGSSYGSAVSVGEIRAMSDAKGVATFNPVGRFLAGWGSSAADIVTLPYTLGREVALTVGDAVGSAIYGGLNWAFGGNQSYRSDSALFRSVETNGVLGTVGNGISGTVRSLPGIAQVDALYRNDVYALGVSGPVTALAGLGTFGAATLPIDLDMFRRIANQGAYADLPVLMDLKTVHSYAQDAGIGLQGVKVRIVRDESLIGSGFGGYTHPNGKSIDLYPDAFSSPEELVRTLGHERMHVYQARTFGAPKGALDLRLNENAAYRLEDSFVKYWHLNGGH